MGRLNGDLEKFVKENSGGGNENIVISMDGGSNWN
jgi:hypothetical protein